MTCKLLILDKTSQLTDISVYQAHIALNLRRICFARVAAQLAPYVECPDAKSASGLSMLEQLRRSPIYFLTSLGVG